MNNLKKAYFAGGCFWCTEAIFLRLKGVIKATPGYCGGNYVNPTYEQVCSGITGHAETVLIEYDSRLISYEKLLNVFFSTHDPTTMNRQGNDVGNHYRSAIYYTDLKQKKYAENFIKKLGNPFKKIGVDKTGRSSMVWGVYGVPETFIIHKGTVIYKHIGPIHMSELEEIVLPILSKIL